MSRKNTLRDKAPRIAYCNGCGKTFEKMHLMRNHRRSFRCGGRFLSDTDRADIRAQRLDNEAVDRFNRQAKKSEDFFKWLGNRNLNGDSTKHYKSVRRERIYQHVK